MATTKMTLRPGSMKIISGEIYADKLFLGCEIEGTPKGAAFINLEIDREAGRSFRPTTAVSLSSDYQHKKFIHSLGLFRMADVNGLRDEARRVAEEHWSKFVPNPEEPPSHLLLEGVLQARPVPNRGGHHLAVTIKGLSYAGFKLEGDLEVIIDSPTSFRCSSRNCGLHRERIASDKSSEVWHRSIPSRHNAAVLAFISPWLRDELVKLNAELRSQERAVLARNLERAEEELQRVKNEVPIREEDLKSARAALEAFDAESSATALGGTSAA